MRSPGPAMAIASAMRVTAWPGPTTISCPPSRRGGEEEEERQDERGQEPGLPSATGADRSSVVMALLSARVVVVARGARARPRAPPAPAPRSSRGVSPPQLAPVLRASRPRGVGAQPHAHRAAVAVAADEARLARPGPSARAPRSPRPRASAGPPPATEPARSHSARHSTVSKVYAFPFVVSACAANCGSLITMRQCSHSSLPRWIGCGSMEQAASSDREQQREERARAPGRWRIGGPGFIGSSSRHAVRGSRSVRFGHSFHSART
jgi:hypothetical protein